MSSLSTRLAACIKERLLRPRGRLTISTLLFNKLTIAVSVTQYFLLSTTLFLRRPLSALYRIPGILRNVSFSTRRPGVVVCDAVVSHSHSKMAPADALADIAAAAVRMC